MTTIKRWSLAAFAAFTIFLFSFYSWLAVAAPPAQLPPVEVSAAQPAIGEADFAVTPVPPPAPVHAGLTAPDTGSDWEPVADQVFNALALALIGWLVRLLSPTILRIGDWIGHRAAAEDLLRDEKMIQLSKIVAMQGLDLALGRMGYTRADLKDVRIRNSVLNFTATFIREQWPEIWKWVDKDQNGQIDWFESQTAGALPAVDHTALRQAATSPAAA